MVMNNSVFKSALYFNMINLFKNNFLPNDNVISYSKAKSGQDNKRFISWEPIKILIGHFFMYNVCVFFVWIIVEYLRMVRPKNDYITFFSASFSAKEDLKSSLVSFKREQKY